jgi:RNA-directed DNA polymerase
MRSKAYQLTRFADDWVITCSSPAQARAALAAATKILGELGVQLHPQKTRIGHVKSGFEFLGYKIKRGRQPLRLPSNKIRSGVKHAALYAYPREKTIQRFMDQVRRLTQRRIPCTMRELIDQLNPVLRGAGHYSKRSHIRGLFNRLDRCKRWRYGLRLPRHPSHQV